jgi:hypothetical protein
MRNQVEDKKLLADELNEGYSRLILDDEMTRAVGERCLMSEK